MDGYVIDIEKASKENNHFRKVLYTATGSQLVVMSLKPGEDIGEEVHDGVSIVVPAGAKHNVINTSKTESLKLYTLYSPPNHRDGVVHETKAQAENDDEHFDGQTTEKL